MKKKFYYSSISSIYYIYYNTVDGNITGVPLNGTFDVPIIRDEVVPETTTNQCRFVFYTQPTAILDGAFETVGPHIPFTKFEIPTSIVSIGDEAFYDCSELAGGGGTNTGMIYLGASAQWNLITKESSWWAGDDIPDNAKVYCVADNTYVLV